MFSWGIKKATPDCDGLMRRIIHLCCFLCTYFFNHPFCGRPCCKTSIIYIIADDPPASTLTSSLLSPVLPLPLVLVNSLPNSCVTYGCWFPSISSFNMFTKSINDSTIFGHFHYSWLNSDALATGCLYRLSELTA